MSSPIPPPGSDRRRFHDAAVARLRELPPDQALAVVRRHHLLALAQHPDLPAALADELLQARRQTLAANLRWIHLFQQAVDALGDVPVCPLKGVYLLSNAYADDPDCRKLSDLDLLVPADRVDEAVHRLSQQLGLEETPTSRRVRRWSAERQLAAAGVLIDLHGRLALRHGARSDWSRLEPVAATVHERPVFVLDRETTWVHLVTHWVRHGPGSSLRWVEDLLRWRENVLDERRADNKAKRIGALPTLLAGERLLQRQVGVSRGETRRAGGWTRTRVRWAERFLWPAAADELLASAHPDGSSNLTRTAASILLASGPVDALRAAATKVGERLSRGRQEAGKPVRESPPPPTEDPSECARRR